MPDNAALQIGRALLAGEKVPDAACDLLVERAVSCDPLEAKEASRQLFRDIVEPLADRFEPQFSTRYVQFFTAVLERLEGRPEFQRFNDRLSASRSREKSAELPTPASPRRCLVLSRVTLGADVAVTSVVLDGLKQAYPDAALTLACGAKTAALFEGDERLSFLPIEYLRGGTLLERLEAWVELSEQIETWAGDAVEECLLVDPDSRLTQLGLLPAAPAGVKEVAFDSRAYGGAGADSIAALTSRWMTETFGVQGALPFVAPSQESLAQGRALRGAAARMATCNWGFGGNDSKRISAGFETAVVVELLRRGWRVLLDQGSGEAESSAALSTAMAAAASGYDDLELYDGSLSGFAGVMASSDLFIGYDSAAGHIAAALGVPGIDLFRGAVSERMMQRWSPWGKQPGQVLKVIEGDRTGRTLQRLAELLP